MAPSAALKSYTRSWMRRRPHERRQQRTDVFRRPVSLSIRRRVGGAAQRASTDPLSLRLPGRHKDCSRSPRHVFQRKCRHDAMSSCVLGTAAAPGNCSVLPCFWLQHERLRSCRALRGSANQFSFRLPGRHKDCSRSPVHVCQRKCHHDAMLGCSLGSAGAAGGHSSILPCFWLRHESPCPCRVMVLWSRCASAKLQTLLDA
ncbi:uncharacterized protein LOC142566690 [Dermacentor variabilis]|uniref:uncharacterized protein LOC142566690 n=1 Tax=Dermacentor variabilis TaxID=34621 RepID=UPI003F5B6065